MYHIPDLKRTKLTESGMLHHIVPLVIIVAFGVFGAGYYVFSRAATPVPDIVSNLSLKGEGKWCITDQNASTAANNPVYSASCGGSTNQQWTYTADAIENKALSGTHCLSLLNNGTTAGTKVVMNTCNGSTSQQWRQIDGKGFQSVSASAGKTPGNCLAVYGGITGQQLRVNTCNMGYDSQGWTQSTYGTATPTPTVTPTPLPSPTPTPSPTPPPTTGGTSGEDVIATLYAYPTLGSWGQIESGAPTVRYAIVNICAPNGTGSGCGSPATEANPAWDGTIAALKNAGITPLYYISTNYDAEPLATVESELANAKTWYGVANPMFDTTSTNDPGYYQALYNYSVGLGATAVVFNPGTIAPQSYMFGSKEIIQMFEGTAGGFEGTSFPAWMKDYPAGEFAATLSEGTTGSIGGDVKDAVNDHIGNFYEDDEAEPPNYSTLPAFWTTELTDVKDAN